jgi:RND family efflux transporter MFP subunit
MPVMLSLANEDGFPHSGVIDFADNRVDPVTGTMQLRGTFENAHRMFKPGMFARVRVPISEEYKAILVSDQAIGTDQGKKYVLVVNDQNVVERRFVKPGPLQDGALRVISEGLKSGEWIVVNGLQRARPGKPITPQRGEMPVLSVGGGAPAQATSEPKEKTP